MRLRTNLVSGLALGACLLTLVACGGAAPTAASPEQNAQAADLPPKPDPGGYEARDEGPQVDRDQAAILAMAGTFKVHFSFKETTTLRPGYKAKDEYTSDALELVEVVENEPGKVVLQHILITGDDGSAMIIKHWRQDWRYEDTHVLSFRGKSTWENQDMPTDHAKGTWTQAVFQVDDSPRYESHGRWVHRGKTAFWESEETWRPLPRREYTKRSDYHVIVGRNRHELTPNGWVHFQDNYKLDLDDQSGNPILVREVGENTYTRTSEANFAKGRAFWQKNQGFFADVRHAWDDILSSQKVIHLDTSPDGQPLFMTLSKLANEGEAPYSPGSQLPQIKQLLEKSVVDAPPAATADRSASR
ncbi:MAG: hypothetical protein H6718_21865 [Polyangiaceae bacterium]|nr:hypothetical protein [Polyangiaceae bacterium]